MKYLSFLWPILLIAGIICVRIFLPDYFIYINHIVLALDALIVLLILIGLGGGGGGAAALNGLAIVLIVVFIWGIFSTIISFMYYPINQEEWAQAVAYIKLIIVIAAPILFVAICKD